MEYKQLREIVEAIRDNGNFDGSGVWTMSLELDTKIGERAVRVSSVSTQCHEIHLDDPLSLDDFGFVVEYHDCYGKTKAPGHARHCELSENTAGQIVDAVLASAEEARRHRAEITSMNWKAKWKSMD